ncbi:transcriptional regulator [Rivularia sp. PCC 7116]|uniref:LysR family transcriptional regulator n=1 Tax=Rivularia sp. PCC 7116 TaxID=373994 RepID=UPI00029EC6EA|nr:LysR family transcriptional regulator [Rivularia sp. PCC 7116]AFY56603.1 transcriptional regulator [Rivularia sp. PCC 7116]
MKNRSLQSIELQDLRYFVAVASHETCNISEVAEKLHMAQPNLSSAIKDLEKSLDVTLFNRKKRPLQLTTAGQEFFQEAVSILTAMNRAVENVRATSKGEIGRLTIGLTSSGSNSILPDILRRFREEFPNVKLIWREMATHNQLQALRERAMDVGFLHLPVGAIDNKELSFTPILEEPLVTVLPENHPLAKTKQIPLIALKEEKFILPDLQLVPGLSQQILYLCKRAGFFPQITLEAAFMLTILGFVAGELGIALLPANVKNIRRKGVVYRPILGVTPKIKMDMVWRRNDTSVILKNFLKIAKEICN